MRRDGPAARLLARLTPGFAWRLGLKSAYGWEQFSFWLCLWPRLCRDEFDILHVQDPMLAFWCRKFRGLGLVRTREILAHGTEEPPEFIERFQYVQHLTEWHLLQARSALAEENATCKLRLAASAGEVTSDFRPETSDSGCSPQPTAHSLQPRRPTVWRAIPNFVDTATFRPAADAEEKSRIRRELGIPERAFVVGSVAAVQKRHKRLDWLISELGQFAEQCRGLGGRGNSPLITRMNANEEINRTGSQDIKQQPGRICGRVQEDDGKTQTSLDFPRRLPAPGCARNPAVADSSCTSCQNYVGPILRPFLLIAGARTDESDAILDLAAGLGPDMANVLLDLPRDRMPELYRALDVFVLCSLFEMQPMAILEAMSSGVPVVLHRHPAFEWTAGAEAERGMGNAERGGRTTDDRPQTSDYDTGNYKLQNANCKLKIGDWEKAESCVDMEREGALAEELARYLDPELRARRGGAARERAVSSFSKQAVVPQYLRMYEEVLGKT